MSPVVVVPVVFMIPVAFVEGVAAIVTIIVRMGPIRTGIGRSPPYPRYPDVTSPLPVPVSIDPRIARPGDRTAHLITKRGRCRADIDAHTRESRRGKSRSQNRTHDPFRFHTFSPLLQPFHCNLTYDANPITAQRFRDFFTVNFSSTGNLW